MGHRNCHLIMVLPCILLLFSCTKHSGMYSGTLNEQSKCVKNCLKETNDALRVHCYTRAISKDPDNPELYLRRGLTYQETFKYTSAISDFKKVIELEPGNTEVYYFLARSSSLVLKKEYALHWLEKAIEAGYEDYAQIAADSSFNNIRNSPRYKILMEKWNNDLSAAKESTLP